MRLSALRVTAFEIMEIIATAGTCWSAAAPSPALSSKESMSFVPGLLYEAGKNWGEADAEVAEAIDFLEYYAREAVRLAFAPRRPFSFRANPAICSIFRWGPER